MLSRNRRSRFVTKANVDFALGVQWSGVRSLLVPFACLVGCGRVSFTPVGDGGPVVTNDTHASDGPTVQSCLAAIPAPIRRYTFDTLALTDSASGNDGSTDGNVASVAGKFGNALQLDGSSARATLPTWLVLDYSVSFWVATTQSAPGTPTDWWFNGQPIIDGDVCGNPPNGDWGISLINGGRISGTFAGPSAQMVNDGGWHHVLLTRRGIDDVLTLYVDGTFEGSADANSDNAIHDAQPFIGLGAGPCTYGSGPYFNGALDELVVYDRVLTATDALILSSCTP